MTPAEARATIERLRGKNAYGVSEYIELTKALLVYYDWSEQGGPEQGNLFESEEVERCCMLRNQ